MNKKLLLVASITHVVRFKARSTMAVLYKLIQIIWSSKARVTWLGLGYVVIYLS